MLFDSTCPDNTCYMRDRLGHCQSTVCIQASRIVAVREPRQKCYWCDELEAGDRLYQHGSDDRGILFEEIRNIRFCPVCGKKLREDRLK